MTHREMYKRDVNPRFGLLFSGGERDMRRVERRQKRRKAAASERGNAGSAPRSQVSNYYYKKHKYTSLPDNSLTRIIAP